LAREGSEYHLAYLKKQEEKGKSLEEDRRARVRAKGGTDPAADGNQANNNIEA
jgi:hypothetical protein